MAGDDKNRGPWGSAGSNGGGRGGSGGNTPDFEEQMRRMQERFRNRRNSGGSGDSGGSGKGGFGLGWIGLPAIALLGLVLWAGTGVAYVDAGQQAVVFQFGKVSRVLDPGLNFHWPIPIETHDIVDTEQSREVTIGQRPGENLMLTQDENITDINFTVKWKVRADQPADFLLNVRGQQQTVRMVSESVMREVAGKSKLTSVMRDRDKVQDEVKEQVQALLDDYRSGILVEGVQLLKADPPSRVLEAFNDVSKAELDAESIINTAIKMRNEIVPVARGRSEAIVQEAEAYRDQVIANAAGEASRFEQILAEYKAAPKVTKERMYFETMERVFEKTDNLFLDQQSGAVPYLPLEPRRSSNR